MALAMPCPIPVQCMVFIFLWKLFAGCQFADDVIKNFYVQMAFYCHFIIFLELTRPYNVQMLHSFNARSASSTSE